MINIDDQNEKEFEEGNSNQVKYNKNQESDMEQLMPEAEFDPEGLQQMAADSIHSDEFAGDNIMNNQQDNYQENRKFNGDEDDNEDNVAEQGFQQWRFPLKTGAQVDLQNPLLEFINYICHSLGFDKNINDELIVMKRNLLKQINISEFSDSAEFKEPCL